MYKHPLTVEGEYPRTVREVLHHSIDMLAEQFPERVVVYHGNPEHFYQHFSAPGYKWPGAGSEKGGSAEHISYEEIVFLPEREGRVQVVSVGDRKHDFGNSIFITDEGSGELSEFRQETNYSVLFQLGLSPRLAEKLLDYYTTRVKDVKNWNISFTVAIERILEDGTNHFGSVPLFAFDSLGVHSSGAFYLNRCGAVLDFRGLERFSGAWDWYLGGSLAQRKEISQYIVAHLLGEKGEETLRDNRFIHPERRGLQDLEEKDEKKVLTPLYI